MKALLFFLSLIFLSLFSYGQPNTPYAPNVKVHDIDGVQHDLHHYLDQNRTVVLEFYNSTKSASISSRPGMLDLYNTVGLGGDLTHAILSIDMDSTTFTESDFRTNYSIPSAITDSIQNFSAYNPDVNKPMFIIICPDRLWKVRYGSIFNDESYITALSDGCSPLSTRVKDGKIFKFVKYPEYCEGKAEVSFYFQNYSQSNTLSVAKIFAREGGIQRGHTTWNGNLEPYEIEEVEMELTGVAGVDFIEFELEQIDGVLDVMDDNNYLNQFLNEGLHVREKLNVEITTDFYPEHIKWYVIQELTGDTVFHNFVQNYMPNTPYVRNLSFDDLGDGCYEFFIEDTFGDGLLNGTTPDGNALGSFRISSDVGVDLFNDINYERGTSRKFSINEHLSTDNFEIEQNIIIAENPFVNTIDIRSTLNGSYDLIIYSVEGKKMLERSNVEGNIAFNTMDWGNGVYLVNITSNSKTQTYKIIK